MATRRTASATSSSSSSAQKAASFANVKACASSAQDGCTHDTLTLSGAYNQFYLCEACDEKFETPFRLSEASLKRLEKKESEERIVLGLDGEMQLSAQDVRDQSAVKDAMRRSSFYRLSLDALTTPEPLPVSLSSSSSTSSSASSASSSASSAPKVWPLLDAALAKLDEKRQSAASKKAKDESAASQEDGRPLTGSKATLEWLALAGVNRAPLSLLLPQAAAHVSAKASVSAAASAIVSASATLSNKKRKHGSADDASSTTPSSRD